MCNSEDFLHYDYVRLAWDIGFTFEEYDTKSTFDLGLIGLVDVDRVAKERDIPTVVKHIPTLLNFRIDKDLGKLLEPNFVKLFRLSQLCIQYLRFCKRYLDNTVALLKNEIISLNTDKEEMEGYLQELKVENDTITRKHEELKATLSTSIHKCDQCGKTFYSEEYLIAHVKRRHESHNDFPIMQTESDKLQLEIKELKQRLNNTERFILKEDKVDKVIKNDKEKDNEKEQESIEPEPNNDTFVGDTIQFKFEQLKNHIEAEINSLKNEDFYRSICEKYIKERVERKLSVSTTQGLSSLDLTKVLPEEEEISTKSDSKSKIINEKESQEINDTKVELEIEKKLSNTEKKQLKEKEVNTDIIEVRLSAIESSTQTDIQAISEGTSMSPQPTPRKTKSEDEEIKTKNKSSEDKNNESQQKENDHKIKTIEMKLAREVELQRETLEHILDLKLSGSLNKMEAQMSAFWEKLNAWESNLTQVTKPNSNSILEDQNGGNTKTKEQKEKASSFSNGEIPKLKKVNSFVNSNNSPINVPKPLPRQLSYNDGFKVSKKPVLVKSNTEVPKNTVVMKTPLNKNDLQKLLDSSDEDSGSQETSGSSEGSSGVSSIEEKPCNIKPSPSFRKRLDETLLQRLKHQDIQTEGKVKTVIAIKPKNNVASAEKTQQNKNNVKHEDDNSITSAVSSEHIKSPTKTNETNYQDLKKRLKTHVRHSMDQKLKDIGVSPHWNSLPDKSFTKAMEIIEHQANLSKKSIPDFHKIRKNIEQTIDKQLAKDNGDHLNLQDVNSRKTKRSISAILPRGNKSGNTKKLQEPNLKSIQPTQQDSNLSESSIDIPLQRVTAKSTMLQLNSSLNLSPTNSTPPTKLSKESPTKQTFLQTVEVHSVQTQQSTNPYSIPISSSINTSQNEVREFYTPSSAITNSKSENSLLVSSQGEVPQPIKKKVLFNLDSESDHDTTTHVSSPKKKTIANFVKQEKSELEKSKQQNQGSKDTMADVHTWSESSDWDISDIT